MSQKQKWFSKKKEYDFNLERKLNGKRLIETNLVKYLGIRIDSKLNWKAQIDDISLKLIRANAMLYKVKDFFNAGILKAIYHALFQSHIRCACIIWGRECMHNQSSSILQKKASRLIHFKERNTHTDSLFLKSKMVKLPDKTKIENCHFITFHL